MAGKYAAILGRLPKLQSDDPYQERVNQRIGEMSRLRAAKENIDAADAETEAREAMRKVVDNLAITCNRMLRTAPNSPAGLARTYAELRRIKDTLEEWESEVNLTIEAISKQLIEQYENADMTSLKLFDGSSVRTQPEPWSKVENKDKFREWCVKNGLERSLALPWQTTNALTKEMLLKGQPEPPGVKAYVKTKIVFTQGS